MAKRFGRMGRAAAILAVFGAVSFIAGSSRAADKVWRFDCGTGQSPVMKGYERLTGAEQ